MKKIIPAVCMSLLGLAAVGTGSYAWFTANSTVKASGLTITATTGSTINISKGYVTSGSITDTQAILDGAHITKGKISPVRIEDTPEDFEAATGNYLDNVSYYKQDEGGRYYKLLSSEYEVDQPVDSGVFVEDSETTRSITASVPATWRNEPTLNNAGVAKGMNVVATATSVENGFDFASAELNTFVANDVVTIYRKSSVVGGTFNLTCKSTHAAVTTKVTLDKALTVGFYSDAETDSNGLHSAKFGELKDNQPNVVTICTLSGLSNNTFYHFRLMEWYDGDSGDCYTNATPTLEQRSVEFSFEATEGAAA